MKFHLEPREIYCGERGASFICVMDSCACVVGEVNSYMRSRHYNEVTIVQGQRCTGPSPKPDRGNETAYSSSDCFHNW